MCLDENLLDYDVGIIKNTMDNMPFPGKINEYKQGKFGNVFFPTKWSN